MSHDFLTHHDPDTASALMFALLTPKDVAFNKIAIRELLSDALRVIDCRSNYRLLAGEAHLRLDHIVSGLTAVVSGAEGVDLEKVYHARLTYVCRKALPRFHSLLSEVLSTLEEPLE